MRDVVLHLPTWLSSQDAGPPVHADELTIIYLISGNPGLISYYEPFLKLLAEGSGRDAVIAGTSLGGFEGSKTASRESLEGTVLHPPSYQRPQLYNLQDQIDLTHERLHAFVACLHSTHPLTNRLAIKVILIGHSVGAYIALELVHCEHGIHTAATPRTFTIRGTMLLTPTIQDIARSPSGNVATPILSTLPFFPALLQMGAAILTTTLPTSWLRGVVSRVTGMTHEHAIDTTVGFLQTPGAVRQALYLARHEMAEIKSNRWGDEVWGAVATTVTAQDTEATQVERPPWAPPKHFFLFAKEDHWVADATRAAVVQAMSGRATIVIDEDGQMGLVHAWCLEQSELVAKIVNGWLEELLRKG